MKGIQDLDRLFNPSSLAIIGASKDNYKSGGQFLKGLIDSGFKGKLYPVNPRETEIMGLRNYRSILDVAEEVDLAYLTVPAITVPQVMAECGQKGVRFVVVHSAGVSELGAEGKADKLLIDICQKVRASAYISGAFGIDYIDESLFAGAGIALEYQEFHHPIYQQVYEPFIPSMSTLDLLFNYGDKSLDVLRGIGVGRMDTLIK